MYTNDGTKRANEIKRINILVEFYVNLFEIQEEIPINWECVCEHETITYFFFDILKI